MTSFYLIISLLAAIAASILGWSKGTAKAGPTGPGGVPPDILLLCPDARSSADGILLSTSPVAGPSQSVGVKAGEPSGAPR